MFGRVAGARRRARRGETKGQDLLLVTASPLHLGRRTRVSEAQLSTGLDPSRSIRAIWRDQLL